MASKLAAGLLVFGLCGLCASARAEPPLLKAFPGAQGFGAMTQGGRGGQVIKVTNLNDAGPGSLRAAIDARGPRIIIFETGGTIQLASPLVVRHPFVTIAGQTAPGGGITLANHEFRVSTSQVIVRFLRVRHGDLARVEGDAISLTAGNNIIIDHCSASWSTDETLSVSQHMTTGPDQLDGVTIQWSIISESLDQSVHAKGAHGYGTLVRGSNGSRYSFHHNLWAHHRARMPRPGNFASASQDRVGPLFDFTNNVFYNWGGSRNDGAGYNVDDDAISRYNFRANAYLTGTNSQSSFGFVESAPGATAFVAGNLVNGQAVEGTDFVKFKRAPEGYFAALAFDAAGLVADDAVAAQALVLARAGASRFRDEVDRRVIDSVHKRTGQIINSQADVGGWPVLDAGQPRSDRDGDGLPDTWEQAHHLNPEDPRDAGRDANANGYPDLEDWLNELADPTS